MDERLLLQEYKEICSRLNPEERQFLGTMLLMSETAAESDEVEGHMGGDYIIYQVAQYHVEDLRREAAEFRKERSTRTQQSTTFFQRLNWGVGDFFIGLGHRMQGRKVSPIPSRR